MPRLNLIVARKKAHLSQAELATKVGAARKTVVAWEAGTQTPQPLMCRQIETALNRKGDEHLFDIVPESLGETQGPLSCETTHPNDRFNPTDSHDDIPESEEETDVDPRRRRINTTIATSAIAASTGLALVNNTPIITGFIIEPAVYLLQARLAIDTAWRDLHEGNYLQAARTVNAHTHTLGQVAYAPTPFQQQAASLAVEMKILQVRLAISNNMLFFSGVDCCIEAVQFGALSGDRNLLALAQFWHGDTYTYFYERPQTAIPLLDDALSNVDGSAFLATLISSDLAIAHAQNHDETKALDYMEMACVGMPGHPELDPFYKGIHFGAAELDQDEGKMLLYLAEYLPNEYAQKAYNLLDKSTSKQAGSEGFLVQALSRKADAARLLGEKDECVACLTQAYGKAPNVHRLSQVDAVLRRVPDDWKAVKAVKDLTSEVSNALVLASG